MIMFTIICPVICIVLEFAINCLNKMKNINNAKILDIKHHFGNKIKLNKDMRTNKLLAKTDIHSRRKYEFKNKKLDKIIKICNYIVIANAVAFFIFFYILMVS